VRYNKAINKLLSNLDCIVAHLIGFVKGGIVMGRPNRNIVIHRDYMDHQLQRVKDVIHLLTEKDRLNAGDIQAIRELLNIYVSFVNVQKHMK
jgi:hypothetical protein